VLTDIGVIIAFLVAVFAIGWFVSWLRARMGGREGDWQLSREPRATQARSMATEMPRYSRGQLLANAAIAASRVAS
jgi:hypothetical protein